eukprot:388984-Rhodomonas_salina.1
MPPIWSCEYLPRKSGTDDLGMMLPGHGQLCRPCELPLRACYVVSGTDGACDATRRLYQSAWPSYGETVPGQLLSAVAFCLSCYTWAMQCLVLVHPRTLVLICVVCCYHQALSSGLWRPWPGMRPRA